MYRISNVEAMYRRENILARTISERLPRADLGRHSWNLVDLTFDKQFSPTVLDTQSTSSDVVVLATDQPSNQFKFPGVN